MKPKLLVVSLHLSGGCFQYSNELIARLNLDKEVYIPSKCLEPINLKHYKTLRFYGYNILLRWLSLFSFLVRMYIGAKLGRYHALLLCGFTSWDYYIMKVWAKTGKTSFYIVHDGKLHLGEASEKNQRQLTDIMSHATSLIFLSHYVHQLVVNNYGIDKPFYIAPHGLIDYGPLPHVDKKQLRPILLFIGRVSKYKGVDLLLEAIKRVPDSLYDRLIIAGKWEYKNTIDYDSKKVEIIDKWLSNEEILQYIAASDIMIFPYLEATQSGVATLAINYLRPSIVTDVGAFKEQFNDQSAVFVRPDSGDLSKAIIDLLQHLERLNSMKRALQQQKKEYSWKQIVDNLSGYLEQNL
uniref:glycosyltransferase family 4 protein n=1 Tax=Alistipes megaguti TaxID=2364787 RepID=UPI000EFA9C8B|nr:glycosyltransferase family 4 protein [Alistipes megaguti]